MEFKNYIGLLEQFVSKDYSLDEKLLNEIRAWAGGELSSEFRENLRAQGLSEPPFYEEYSVLGLGSNYRIVLDDKSAARYLALIDDFKTKDIGNHTWRWSGEYSDYANVIGTFFVSNSFDISMQIGKTTKVKVYNGDKKKALNYLLELSGEISFLFPESTREEFNEKIKEEEEFHFSHNLANSIISISKYLAENKLPCRIDLSSDWYHAKNEREGKKESIVYNPLNVELKHINKW